MRNRWGGAAAAAILLSFWLGGCASVAEFRKLERQVLERRTESDGVEGQRIADLRVEVDSLDQRLAQLEGRLDMVGRDASEAREEARRARAEIAAVSGGAPMPGQLPVDSGAPPAGGPPVEPPEGASAPPGASGSSVAEVSDYREAHSAWRSGDHDACIDRFRRFLQTYPASDYADDAAYWLADCHFKQGDYKAAILRFDDVVARYPDGEKSADALFRQGEALLRLGPGYAKAAGKAFERVIEEYPGSPRASQAREQLDLL